MARYEQFERFTFKPWMGVTAGVLICLIVGSDATDMAIIARGLGMTLFFGSLFVSYRRRKQPGQGASVSELKAVLFAGLFGLLTLGFIIEWVYDHWFR